MESIDSVVCNVATALGLWEVSVPPPFCLFVFCLFFVCLFCFVCLLSGDAGGCKLFWMVNEGPERTRHTVSSLAILRNQPTSCLAPCHYTFLPPFHSGVAAR